MVYDLDQTCPRRPLAHIYCDLERARRLAENSNPDRWLVQLRFADNALAIDCERPTNPENPWLQLDNPSSPWKGFRRYWAPALQVSAFRAGATG